MTSWLRSQRLLRNGDGRTKGHSVAVICAWVANQAACHAIVDNLALT